MKTAFQNCPRDIFIPQEYREEAFLDNPIRVESMNFNISAPHMHATCLEALDIRPGHRVLDVGTGCGFIAAAAAFLTGKRGAVVAIDKKKDCVTLAKNNVQRLRGRDDATTQHRGGNSTAHPDSSGYATEAADCTFEQADVFLLSGSSHQGQYDRIHVGGAVPADKLVPIIQLLKDTGGLIVVPVAPSDLRVIITKPDGSIVSKVISQVRFTDLEVPSDADIITVRLKTERKVRTTTEVMPSTYEKDLQAIKDQILVAMEVDADNTSRMNPRGNGGEHSKRVSVTKFFGTSPDGVIDAFPPSPLAKDVHRYAAAERASEDGLGKDQDHNDTELFTNIVPLPRHAQNRRVGELVELLKDPDCVLKGAGFEIPAHSVALRHRCDHFRARYESGMKDASLAIINVPDHFSNKRAMECLLQYVYYDCTTEMDPYLAVDVLHLAQFYGIQRLAQLCEGILAKMIRAGQRSSTSVENIAEAAVTLLALAEDQSLPHLKAVALDFMIHHFEQVRATEAYAALSKEHVDCIAQGACRELQRTKEVIHDVKDSHDVSSFRGEGDAGDNGF